MIAVLDAIVQPGRAVRQLQFSDVSELTTQGSGNNTYAVLETNRGTLECDIGTVAIQAAGGAIKWLTPSGWADFT